MEEVLIRDLMTKNVIQVTAKTLLKTIYKTMRDNKLSSVVVSKQNVPIGIITNSDMVNILAEAISNDSNKKITADTFMSSPPVVFNSDMSAFEALFLAQTRSIKHLPVVDEQNKLCGMVAPAQLLKSNYRLIEAQSELARVVESNKKLYKLNIDESTSTDSPHEDRLLNIGNRHFMQMDLQFTHELSLRYDRRYSIILVDVDYYESYYDHYGFEQSIQMLRRIVEFLKQSLRGSDRLYRFQDATILILLPETGLDSTNLLADRLVEGLAKLAIPNIKCPTGVITASAGVASEEPENYKDINWEQLLERAEKALATAEEMGRNQIAISEGPDTIYTDAVSSF